MSRIWLVHEGCERRGMDWVKRGALNRLLPTITAAMIIILSVDRVDACPRRWSAWICCRCLLVLLVLLPDGVLESLRTPPNFVAVFGRDVITSESYFPTHHLG